MDGNTLNRILEIAFEKRVSDIHFEVESPPMFRARGHLLRSKLEDLTADDTMFIARTVMEHHNKVLPDDIKEFDTSYTLPEIGRFRVSIFRQRGTIGIVMRAIPHYIGTFDELHLPEVLAQITQAPNGLVLVTGPTGNGKSTTLASMIRYINENHSYNIITIEDPIEFLFRSSKSCIIQRELGIDTDSFSSALKAAMRMDPDVIMVGEMRDLETIDSCIKAAETGHLVFSTLHTNNAAATINRIVGHYPSESQEIVRHRLAEILVGTVSLRLIRDKTGENVVPVLEVMLSTGAIRACIRDGKLDELEAHIEKGRDEYNMQSMDQNLIQLCKDDIITLDEAKRISHSSDLERKLTYDR
ncbi:MAG: PilT/PilU family type 4a pilus ATPase [Nitrospirota bacterium]|nr:MAG: PilT/PilU family type 4a pilus ATPase [Nitrospirota bacterium]